jgi:hypothetical protein
MLKFLSNSPPLNQDEVAQLKKWWLADRNGVRDGLVDFLIRHQVFAKDSLKTVDLLRKGMITFVDPRRLFADGGIDRLRGKLKPSLVLTPAVPAAPARPSTILSRPKSTPDTHVVAIDDVQTSRGGPSQTLTLGSMLGQCLLVEQIGKGGSALVFRAIHRGMNLPVAVKVLQREVLQNDPNVYVQLKAEAQLLQQLQHPNILRLFEFEDNPQFPYLVLEYIEGMSLAELIQQSGRIRADRAVNFIRQIADGLRAAHRLGVIHRDVKPANVLLARDGNAKLADLGLAMVVSENKLVANASASSTCLETLAGTVAYIAPEQALSNPGLDHRADIYSLGASFYHMVTGDIPFNGKRMEIILKHIQEAPVPPHQVAPGLDETVSRVILKMMAKAPAQRYQDYDELIGALDSIRTNTGSQYAGVAPGPKGSGLR